MVLDAGAGAAASAGLTGVMDDASQAAKARAEIIPARRSEARMDMSLFTFVTIPIMDAKSRHFQP